MKWKSWSIQLLFARFPSTTVYRDCVSTDSMVADMTTSYPILDKCKAFGCAVWFFAQNYFEFWRGIFSVKQLMTFELFDLYCILWTSSCTPQGSSSAFKRPLRIPAENLVGGFSLTAMYAKWNAWSFQLLAWFSFIVVVVYDDSVPMKVTTSQSKWSSDKCRETVRADLSYGSEN